MHSTNAVSGATVALPARRRPGRVAPGAPGACAAPAASCGAGGVQAPPVLDIRSGQAIPASPQHTWPAIVAAWAAAQASPHTCRHYCCSWAAFLEFLGTDGEPGRITSDDVNAWTAILRARGQAASTIVSRLAACASLFDFIAQHAPELVTDRRGALRTNPFRNDAVRRPRVRPYSSARPLAEATVQRLLRAINSDCLNGARDRALLLTALATGWPGGALLGLRYAGAEGGGEGGEGTQLWLRKGASGGPEPLPQVAFAAIRHYLDLAGRWPLTPGDFVWLPLRTHGVVNFGIAQPDPHQPISSTQANNILRRRLAAAGAAHPEQYHMRDLRHTYSRKYLAAGGDVGGLGDRLTHSRPAVTLRYMARLAQSVDDSALLEGWL